MAGSRRARRGLATWLTATSTPLFVIDDRQVLLVFNEGCEQLTGWPAAEVIGEACVPAPHADPTDPVTLTNVLAPPTAVINGDAGAKRASVPHREGGRREVLVHYFPLPSDSDSTRNHILGIITIADGKGETLLPDRGDALQDMLSALLARSFDRHRLDSLVAASPAAERVVAQVRLASQSRAPLVVVGPRGAGRAHVAQVIHRLRFDSPGPCIAIDCRTLSHFELHRVIQRMFEGVESSLSRGDEVETSLLLRNVEELPRDLQELVDQRWHATGSVLPLMATASEEFRTEPDPKLFTPRLWHQLMTLVIHVPALVERPEDIAPLAQYLLLECGDEHANEREGMTFSVEVLEQFQRYPWPGNVRELKQVIEEARAQCEQLIVETGHLPFRFRTGWEAQSLPPRQRRSTFQLETYLAEVERGLILEALETSAGNKTEAANLLGIPRAKLYRRLEQLGIAEEASGEEE